MDRYTLKIHFWGNTQKYTLGKYTLVKYTLGKYILQIHFGKIQFGWIHFEKIHFKKIHLRKIHFGKIHIGKIHFEITTKSDFFHTLIAGSYMAQWKASNKKNRKKAVRLTKRGVTPLQLDRNYFDPFLASTDALEVMLVTQSASADLAIKYKCDPGEWSKIRIYLF